jgi:hypothetical protein
MDQPQKLPGQPVKTTGSLCSLYGRNRRNQPNGKKRNHHWAAVHNPNSGAGSLGRASNPLSMITSSPAPVPRIKQYPLSRRLTGATPQQAGRGVSGRRLVYPAGHVGAAAPGASLPSPAA